MRTWLPLCLFVALFSYDLPVEACMHGKEPGAVAQKQQSGLIVYHKGVEHLVLRATFRSKGKPLPQLAWIITVPTVPSSYGVVSKGLFSKLERQLLRKPKSKGLRRARRRL